MTALQVLGCYNTPQRNWTRCAYTLFASWLNNQYILSAFCQPGPILHIYTRMRHSARFSTPGERVVGRGLP
jgi:hypothetical protein